MGHQIVKQPNGLYAVWSSVVDNFILWDATAEDILVEEQVEMYERVAKRVRDTLASLERGEQPPQLPTFDECIRTIRALHGEADDTLAHMKQNGMVK